jgi:hypothetical protein
MKNKNKQNANKLKENLEISSQDGIDGMETQYLTTKKKGNINTNLESPCCKFNTNSRLGIQAKFIARKSGKNV